MRISKSPWLYECWPLRCITVIVTDKIYLIFHTSLVGRLIIQYNIINMRLYCTTRIVRQ